MNVKTLKLVSPVKLVCRSAFGSRTLVLAGLLWLVSLGLGCRSIGDLFEARVVSTATFAGISPVS
jgi:hypothetical protein